MKRTLHNDMLGGHCRQGIKVVEERAFSNIFIEKVYFLGFKKFHSKSLNIPCQYYSDVCI